MEKITIDAQIHLLNSAHPPFTFRNQSADFGRSVETRHFPPDIYFETALPCGKRSSRIFPFERIEPVPNKCRFVP